MARIFIDTSDMDTALAVRQAAEADGHTVQLISSAAEIDAGMGPAEHTALILTGVPGSDLSRRLMVPFASRIPRPPILAFSGGRLEQRKELARQADIDECLGLPVAREEVQVVLQKLLDRVQVQAETGIIGRTEAMQEVLERIHLLAPVQSTVLITGESGTGKELAARAIHGQSHRRVKPFIAINCSAISQSLLESELFGHEKGAFTGATSRRKGMFELADGGTLLLDEIGEMSLPLQTRLLRVLESRRFMRVGGDVEIQVDVRVIAATNRNLADAVAQGSFRRDLYYRLHVLHLELPPLRARKADIPILIRRFITELSQAHSRDFKGLSAEASQILMDYAWPGNVRELRNLVESMVVLAPGAVIQAADIPSQIREGRGRGFLPIPTFSTGAGPDAKTGDGGLPLSRLPQMEFIFRTLVELKIDVEDLRAEFERYRERHPEVGELLGVPKSSPGAEFIEIGEIGEMSEIGMGLSRLGSGGGSTESGEFRAEQAGTIRFRSGMTMSELEREAIEATLREVGGNRRRAAEKLDIGERTLYRKLKQYEIDI